MQKSFSPNSPASIAWNMMLLTVGALLFSFGVKCIAQPHGFVAGGIFGTSLLISYIDDRLSVGVLYALLNIPVLLLGWCFLSRRFILYTIYSITVASIASELLTFNAGVTQPILAAVAAGIVCGAGSGIAVRSLGSDGGLTVISLILHDKYNLNVGTFNTAFNAVLFLVALPIIKVDNVIYSMIITYLTSTLMSYFMGMFDERKLMFIISDQYELIASNILKYLGRGCTMLHGRGAFTMQEREVLMTVVNNYQLRRVEEIVFAADPSAFVIIENTQQVLGKGFSSRKRY
ncbi:YitT family protein [Desulfovibrio cuneatus]|uniref:YitT family protein n=1 Tax=Desulfovibrio cuneatus TaxID=159728 RepID=UPI000427EEB4|nr:YitT family protein [Desulfovibrio cuneatus]